MTIAASTPGETAAAPTRHGRGRPPAVLDDAQVVKDLTRLMLWSAFGWSIQRIAEADGVSEATVRRGIERGRTLAASRFRASADDEAEDDARRAERNVRRRVSRARSRSFD